MQTVTETTTAEPAPISAFLGKTPGPEPGIEELVPETVVPGPGPEIVAPPRVVVPSTTEGPGEGYRVTPRAGELEPYGPQYPGIDDMDGQMELIEEEVEEEKEEEEKEVAVRLLLVQNLQHR